MALEFTRLTLRRLDIPFRFTFTHAAKSRQRADQILVELTTKDGISGFGEMLPRPYVTGETLESCWDDARRLWWPRIAALRLGSNPLAQLSPLYLHADQNRRHASYAGFDVAVLDAWSRSKNITLQALLAAEKANGTSLLPVVGPIGMGVPPGLLAAAYSVLGLHHLKVKIGDTKSLKRLTAVRRWSPAHLLVDANRAYSAGEAAAFLVEAASRRLKIARFEDPCIDRLDSPAIQALCEAADQLGVRLVADETLVSQADASIASRFGGKMVWNLRVGKNGGVSGVLALAAQARAAGTNVRLGAMVGESALTDNATQAVAAALPQDLAEARESSFPALLLARKIWRRDPNGSTVGLGVQPEEDALERVTVEKLVLEA